MVTSRGFSSTRTRHCSVVYSSYRPREPRQSPLTPKHVLPVVENKYLNLLRSRTLNVPRIVCIVYILFLHKKKKKKFFLLRQYLNRSASKTSNGIYVFVPTLLAGRASACSSRFGQVPHMYTCIRRDTEDRSYMSPVGVSLRQRRLANL